MTFLILTLIFVCAILQEICCYENLSRKSSTVLTQSSTGYNKMASLANDGDLQTTFLHCAHTDYGHGIAWFQVDFGNPYNILNVKIYYRNEGNVTGWKQYRFRQFYLDVSDSPATQTTTAQRTRCYTDNTTAPNLPPNIIDIPCKHTARYVIVETTFHAPERYRGAILEICEIEVYGCRLGTWGSNCTGVCRNCQNGECDVQNGFCTRGCVPGWKGDTCSIMCSPRCAKGSCEQHTGACSAGCVQNRTGDQCERCDVTHYGPDCSRECSVNCIQKNCNNNTGSCTQGCKTGFYGDSCNNVCGSCRAGCKRQTGECEGACPVGKFGTQCDKTCNQNCQNECYKNTRVCMTCIDGMIGELCNQLCGCDRYTGNCECKPAQQLSSPTTNTQPLLYGVAAVLCFSLCLSIFSFTWILKKWMCKRQNNRQSPVNEINVTQAQIVCDSVRNNVGHQELRQISGPSNHTKF